MRARVRRRPASLLRGADAVVLLGYLYVITEPLLAAFPGRILNIHDADLHARATPHGGPRYPGLHATRDAIVAGERGDAQQRRTLVTPTSTAGPGVVARGSRRFPSRRSSTSRGAAASTTSSARYAYAQREWMMRSTWGAWRTAGR